MSVFLKCSHQEEPQPYVGVDPACSRPAIFCVEHDAHVNKEGLLHQMMPLAQLRRTINEKKFRMADKVAVLTDQYSAFMDQLIKEITELKLNKIVELSMLWLRELAANEDEYENLRKLYRNDYEGLTCKDVHWLYFKVIGNEKLEKQKLEEIECYKEICKVMSTLQSSVKARLMISEKVMELEGVVQKGELLKRALPDRKILKENTKEILLEVLNGQAFELKYNKITLRDNSRSFQSIFSKYPLIEHTNYHLFVQTKYTNVLLGICTEQLKKAVSEIHDLHYSQHSIVFNCSNGCLYRDGMFESGSAHLTKGQKELELILRVTDLEILILLGKSVVCRTNIEHFKKGRLFLHLLMRTGGDSIEIDRDKFIIIPEEQAPLVEPTKNHFSDIIEEEASLSSEPKISIDQAFVSKLELSEPESLRPREPIVRENLRKHSDPTRIEAAPMLESFMQIGRNKGNSSANLIQSIGMKKSIPLDNSLEDKISKRATAPIKKSNTLRSGERSKVFIEMEHSMQPSEPEEASSRYASHVYDEFNVHGEVKEKESLINPVIMLPLKKSQFEISLLSSVNDNNMSPLPSAKLLQKKASGLTNTLNGIKATQNHYEDDWI